MGYIELLGGASTLADSIEVDDWPSVKIACANWFDLRKEN